MTAEWTQPSVRRDFVEWHLGRRPYVFWALDVDTPAVAERVAWYSRLLGDCLLDGYLRQPHVTLDVCGFPAWQPGRDDEFGRELLAGQLAALREAGVAPFSIEVGDPDSFLSAPYMAVADIDGGIAALRRCLAINGEHRLFGDFVPHVTIGLYAKASRFQQIREHLLAGRFDQGLVLPVERLSLMSYAPGEIGGRLKCLADYWLGSGYWCWHAAGQADGLGFLMPGSEGACLAEN